MQYFYSGQIRRFLAQFIRIMSGFQVDFGRDSSGSTVYRAVPCTYGDQSRQAAQIMRANSTNTSITVPQISCYITEMKYDRERIQEPNFVKKVSVIRRNVDPITGSYLNEPGDKFTVERLMPVPYTLTVKADIWTSNTNQKLQLLEQICTLFNPSMEVQGTDNFLDWTSISLVDLQSVTWTSRNIPMGAEDAIDVASLVFDMPIWLSAPAKVKKLGVVTNIITELYDANGSLREDLLEQGFKPEDFILDRELTGSGTGMDLFADPLDSEGKWQNNVPTIDEQGNVSNELIPAIPRTMGLRNSTGYSVIVFNNQITLIKPAGSLLEGTDDDITELSEDQLIPWGAAITQMGLNFRDGATRLFLRQNDQVEVVGTVSLTSAGSSKLLFSVDVDTIPSNTQPSIDRIINPLKQAPGYNLPAAVTGQRYLLLDDIGDNMNNQGALAWRGLDNTDLVALQYDIIEFNGASWVVSFRPNINSGPQYITNLTNGQQFKWNGAEWIRSWEGLYRDGEWRLE